MCLTIKIGHWIGRTLGTRINSVADNVFVEITFTGLYERQYLTVCQSPPSTAYSRTQEVPQACATT